MARLVLMGVEDDPTCRLLEARLEGLARALPVFTVAKRLVAAGPAAAAVNDTTLAEINAQHEWDLRHSDLPVVWRQLATGNQAARLIGGFDAVSTWAVHWYGDAALAAFAAADATVTATATASVGTTATATANIMPSSSPSPPTACETSDDYTSTTTKADEDAMSLTTTACDANAAIPPKIPTPSLSNLPSPPSPSWQQQQQHPARVVSVIGAVGAVAYNLLTALLTLGEGEQQQHEPRSTPAHALSPLEIVLCDAPILRTSLEGLAMEVEDCALGGAGQRRVRVRVETEADRALRNATVALLLAPEPTTTPTDTAIDATTAKVKAKAKAAAEAATAAATATATVAVAAAAAVETEAEAGAEAEAEAREVCAAAYTRWGSAFEALVATGETPPLAVVAGCGVLSPATCATLLCRAAPSLPRAGVTFCTHSVRNAACARVAAHVTRHEHHHSARATPDQIDGMLVWGDGSIKRSLIDPRFATMVWPPGSGGAGSSDMEVMPLAAVLRDPYFIDVLMPSAVIDRDAAVRRARSDRGAAPVAAMAAARAAAQHVAALTRGKGEPGDTETESRMPISLGVWTAGNPFGLPEDMFFACPVTVDEDGTFHFAPECAPKKGEGSDTIIACARHVTADRDLALS